VDCKTGVRSALYLRGSSPAGVGLWCDSHIADTTDNFPNIDIPVVSVIWTYTGLPPEEIKRRIVTISERAATTTVNDIEHIESQSYNGVGVIKIFFQPKANIADATAQVTVICQTLLHSLPPGITPPNIITYSASSVPVLQLSLNGKTLSEQQLNDLATDFIRTQLATIEEPSLPGPYGGKVRVATVDLDPRALLAVGISGADVIKALNMQNLILPQGTAKIGNREYNVECRRVYSHPVDKATGLICDQTLLLTGFYQAKDYPDKLRRVKYHDIETDKTLVFLTCKCV